MNKKGEWSLSPAYDLTYAFDPSSIWTGKHQMSINGKVENIELISKLKKLFEEFKDLGYSLVWNTESSHCGCKNKTATNNISAQSDENYKIFDNYYKVLEYAENDEVCLNKNKIKVYGEAFGEILPYIYYI